MSTLLGDLVAFLKRPALRDLDVADAVALMLMLASRRTLVPPSMSMSRRRWGAERNGN